MKWLTAGFSNAWADPNARHGPAARARTVLQQARAQLAVRLGCEPSEVWFAPNADIALATAIRAIAAARPGLPVLACALERLSALRTLDGLEPGRAVRILPVDRFGRLDPCDPAVREPAAVLVVQAANREIGTCQDLPAIAAVRHPDAALVVDASAVRSPADLPGQFDAMVLDPSMWGGPDGMAVLICRSRTPWQPSAPATLGDRFPGRCSVAQAAAAAMTLPNSSQESAEEARIRLLVHRLSDRLERTIPDMVLLGSPDHRLGHVLALSVLYVNAEQLVDRLTELGFAVHSGSACTSDTRRPSHVLTAIGALTHGNLRISLPPGCPSHEVDLLAEAIAGLVEEQRRDAGLA